MENIARLSFMSYNHNMSVPKQRICIAFNAVIRLNPQVPARQQITGIKAFVERLAARQQLSRTQLYERVSIYKIDKTV